MNSWGAPAFANSWFTAGARGGANPNWADSVNSNGWTMSGYQNRWTVPGNQNRWTGPGNVNGFTAPSLMSQIVPGPSQPMNFHQPPQRFPPNIQTGPGFNQQPHGKRKRGQMRWTGAQPDPPAKRQKTPKKKKDKDHVPEPPALVLPPDMPYEDHLSLTIWQNYLDFRQPNELYQKKMSLRRTLCDLLEPFGNNCIFVVGSSINGFGSKKSDLDLCLHITSDRSRLSNRLSSAILLGIKSALLASRLFSDVQYIPARVPILKFTHSSSRIECDLNLNNTPGILNTRMLALYCAIDWRVRPLGMYFKHWARMCDIHDASRGRFSSYALNLMLIHFLQSGCSPPVLPCLHKNFSHLLPQNQAGKKVIDMSVGKLPKALTTWRSSSKNHQNLGQLFHELITYYSNARFDEEAFSVRLGSRLPMRVAINQQPPEDLRRTLSGRSNSKVFVEEPFTCTNASRSPFDETVFALVRRAFAKTHRFLRLRKDLAEVAPV